MDGQKDFVLGGGEVKLSDDAPRPTVRPPRKITQDVRRHKFPCKN